MNIGFFSDTFHPQINGVVLSIDLFRAELERRGHKVYVFAPSFKKGDDDTLGISPHLWGKLEHGDDDERVFRFRSMTSVFVKEYPLAIPVSFRTTVELSKLDLDIIHSHDPFNLGVFADLVSYSKNIPLVHTFHTLYADYVHYVLGRNFTVTKKLAERLSAAYCNRCDHIIAPSQKLLTLLEEYGVTKPLSVVPTGIDLSSFLHVAKGVFRQKYGIAPHEKFALFVGRIGKEKNTEFLIRAQTVLSQASQDYRLVIIGDGVEREHLAKQVDELGLGDRVMFTGYLPRPQVLEAYADCDVFAFASQTDTQGMVLLEAAASGKPIVMVSDPGLTDLVKDGETGFVTRADEQEFAAKVREIYENPQLAHEMGERMRELIKPYSIERQTDRLEELYKNLIQAHTSANWREKFWRELKQEIPLEKFRKFPLKLTRLLRPDADDDKD